MVYKENINNRLIDDLDGRNENWDTLEALTTELTTARNGEVSLDERLDKMDNRSLKLKNLVTNGDFALPSLTDWAGYASSISVINNALEVIGNGVNNRNGADYSIYKSFNNDDVVYTRVKVKTSDSIAQSLRIEIMNNTIYSVLASSRVNSPTTDVFYDLSTLHKYTVAETSRARLMVRTYYADETTQNGKKLTIDNVLFINLTSTFGAGNEPTKEEMDKLIDLLGGWFDGEITVTQKTLATWLLNEIRLKVNRQQEDWIEPTLQNGWTPMSAVLKPYFYKDTLGRVYLKGKIGTGALNQSIFILPIGYRPSQTLNFVVSSNNAFGNIYISTEGAVVVNIGAVTNVSLDNVDFRTEG